MLTDDFAYLGLLDRFHSHYRNYRWSISSGFHNIYSHRSINNIVLAKQEEEDQ